MLYQAMQEQYGLLFWMDELFPILFQTTPGGVVAEPNQITFAIGHLSRDANLVAVEVVGLLTAFSVFIDVISIGETACVRTAYTLRQNWRFCAGYGLLFTLLNSGGEFFETHPK